jgi:hypothetical protein
MHSVLSDPHGRVLPVVAQDTSEPVWDAAHHPMRRRQHMWRAVPGRVDAGRPPRLPAPALRDIQPRTGLVSEAAS